MVNTKLINFIATFVSIGLYLVIISIVVYISKDDIKNFTSFGYDIEKTVIVSLDNLNIKNKNTKSKSTKPDIIKISSNTKKESKKDSRDIFQKKAKDLFSTVRVDKKDANAIEEKIKQNKARASRLKKQSASELFKSSTHEKEKLIKELSGIKKLIKKSKTKIKGKNDDKYFAKVSAIIMEKWANTIATKDGIKATVIIKITKNGKLTYRNLKKSFNNIFDRKLKQFLDTLTKEKFPNYTDDDYIEAEFLFSDREGN